MGKITVLSPNPGGQKQLKRYKNRIHTVSQAMKGNIDVEHPTATTPKLKISPRNFTPTVKIYEENYYAGERRRRIYFTPGKYAEKTEEEKQK